jgi:hypothetical protein
MFSPTEIPTSSTTGRPRDPETQAYIDAVQRLQSTGGALTTTIPHCTLSKETAGGGEGKTTRYVDKRIRTAVTALTTASRELNISVRKQLVEENEGVKITFWVVEKIHRPRKNTEEKPAVETAKPAKITPSAMATKKS